MRRTERRGYRLAKAVELLVEVRRRTKNLVPAASPMEACPMESGRGGAGCSQGRAAESQGKMEGGKYTWWGCQGDVFCCEYRTVERLLRGVGCVWFSHLRYIYLGFVVFFKGDFECCESC